MHLSIHYLYLLPSLQYLFLAVESQIIVESVLLLLYLEVSYTTVTAMKILLMFVALFMVFSITLILGRRLKHRSKQFMNYMVILIQSVYLFALLNNSATRINRYSTFVIHVAKNSCKIHISNVFSFCIHLIVPEMSSKE